MASHIPRLRRGWMSVICLAPMCCKRARTRLGSCLIPSHRTWVERAAALQMCDYKRFGEHCHICADMPGYVGPPEPEV